MKAVRWGILGPGSISRTFSEALLEAHDAGITAVGSRDRGRAEVFAADFGASRAHGSYAELAADPEVDAVYIGTPHSRHADDAILCLEAGKHVLCEKPLALSRAQAERMFAAARRCDRLLMEAMWTRFLPSLLDVRRRLAAGEIGEPRLLQADFGIRPAFDPHSRLFDPALGGGALLDLGVYTVSLGHWLFGTPLSVAGTARLGPTGVDDDSAELLSHEDGRITLGFQSMRIETPREAVIRGTDGWIRLHEPWWGARRVTVKSGDGGPVELEFELRGRGYTHMVEAFMDLLRADRRESDVMPPDDSLAVLSTMDELRRQWGVSYPGE